MFTPIELDKSRNLRYGVKAIALIERKLEKNFNQVDFNNLTVDEIMVIAWAGLAHEDADITPEKMLDMIDERNVKLSYVVGKIIDAVSEAFPDENPTQATAD